jgi:ubiquinone/menaquinone biosynthesis C-methylase UbiE
MSGQDLVRRIQAHYEEQIPLGERWSDPDYPYSWRNPIGYYQRDRTRRALIRLLNKHKVMLTGCSLLDIGCGTGDWLRFFAELTGTSSSLAGLDLSPNSLRRAKQVNGDIGYSLADARHLPFAEATFGMVCQFVTFEHLQDPADLAPACAEVARVCAPAGWFIWFDILPVKSAYQRGFTLHDVRELFPDFQVVDHESIFRLVQLPGRTLSTAYALARRSPLLAELVERLVPGPANNLMVLLRKNV